VFVWICVWLVLLGLFCFVLCLGVVAKICTTTTWALGLFAFLVWAVLWLLFGCGKIICATSYTWFLCWGLWVWLWENVSICFFACLAKDYFVVLNLPVPSMQGGVQVLLVVATGVRDMVVTIVVASANRLIFLFVAYVGG
jgi:hypothetical protein